MRTCKPLFLLIIALILQFPCSADEVPDSLCSAFEIYVTKNKISYDFQIDYSLINLDTIELNDAPFLTSNEIESYDTVNHIINLKIPVDSLYFPSPNVYGQMFVVLIDKEPVYCGFFWSVISSVPCNWIFIEDPNEPNGLNDFQIQISTGYPDHSFFQGNDPRNSSKVFDALQPCNDGLTGPVYFPFPTENAYWNVFYAGTCHEGPPDTTILRYTIRGDTTINDIQYHKLCMATGDKFQPKIIGIGGIREADKKIYYDGLTILSATSGEYLLYDFTAQVGDTIKHDPQGGFYSVVLDIDSVMIVDNYRKRYKIKSHSFGQSPDYIIEGIGSVLNGLLGNISDITTCGTHYWEHVCFMENGIEKYLNPAFDDCYSYRPEDINDLIEVDAGEDTTYCVGLYPGTMYLGKKLRVENGVEPYSIRWECRYKVTPTLIYSASNFLNDTTVISPYFTDWNASHGWLKFIVHVTDSLGNYAKDSINVRFSTFAYLTGYSVIEVEKGDSVFFSQTSIGGGIEPLTFRWQPAVGLTNPDTLVTWCKTDSLTEWRNEYGVIATDSCGCVSSPNLAYEVRVISTAINDKNLDKEGLNIRQSGTSVFFNNPYKQKSRVTLVSLDGKILSAFEITSDNFEIMSLLKTKGVYILKISAGEITESKKIINY